MKYHILVKTTLALVLFITQHADAREYKLNEVVKKFVEYSPELKAAQSQYMASHYSRKRAASLFFPQISLNASATDYKNPSLLSAPGQALTGKTYQGSIDLVQPLFSGGAIWNGLEVAGLNKSLQEQAYLQNKQESISSIIQLALSMAALREQLSILEESQKYQERFFKLTQSKAQRGAAKNYELSQARADYLSYTPRIESAKTALTETQNRLRTNIGLNDNEPITVILPPPQKTESLNFETLIEQALQNRPTIKQSEISVAIAKKQKWLNLAEDMPSLNVVGSMGYRSPTQDDFSKDTTKFHSVGLSLKIPLFSGLSSIHKYQTAEENIRVSEHSLASAKNNLKTDVRTALDNVSSSRELFVSSGEWAKEARKALNASIDSYRIGIITSVQVIQVQRGWEQAELSLIQNKQTYQTSLLNLRKSIGVDLEKVYTEN